RRTVRKYILGLDSPCARRRGERGATEARSTGVDDGYGSWTDLGFCTHRMDTLDNWSDGMTKIAFMFPGQGSFQLGMGREIAEAVPEAMAVYEEGSVASGLDLRRLCFSGTDEELTRTDLQQPAL